MRTEINKCKSKFGPDTVNIFRQLLGLDEVKWGDEIVMIDSQAGNEDDDDHNHNATLIKTKQTILSDF
ncbi:MAG: hypothetical protein WAL24_06345 [Nitrososphaeraceae archaeon]